MKNDYETVQFIRPEFRALALWVLDADKRANEAFGKVDLAQWAAVKTESETYWNAASMVMSEAELDTLSDATRK